MFRGRHSERWKEPLVNRGPDPVQYSGIIKFYSTLANQTSHETNLAVPGGLTNVPTDSGGLAIKPGFYICQRINDICLQRCWFGTKSGILSVKEGITLITYLQSARLYPEGRR